MPQPTQPLQVTLQQVQRSSAGNTDFANNNNAKATTSDNGKHSGAASTFENLSIPCAPRVRPVAAGGGGGGAPGGGAACRSSSSEIASADMSRNTLLGEDGETGGGCHALKGGGGAVLEGAAPQQTRILPDMYTA
jgi:hypothetical protein